jgi:hypothetical protein
MKEGLAGHVACMVAMRNADKIFLGKPEGERPLGRYGCKWEYTIRTDVREIGWEGVWECRHIASHTFNLIIRWR